MTHPTTPSRLLKLRKQQAKLAELLVHRAASERQSLVARIESHRNEIDALSSLSDWTQLSGLVQANQVSLRMRVLHDALLGKLEELDAKVTQASETALKARVIAEGLSTLHERNVAAWNASQEKKDQHFLDELALRQFVGGQRD